MARSDLEDLLVRRFVPLNHGFNMWKSANHRKLEGPLIFETVGDLKKIAKKGKVYLLPPRDITMVFHVLV